MNSINPKKLLNSKWTALSPKGFDDIQPGSRKIGDAFSGEIVAWNTPPTETLSIPDFQGCSSVTHLEYKRQN